MKVTFLGTGTSQGVPVIGCRCEICRSLDFRDKRLRTSILIETPSSSLVIDTGPDFRSQMLRENVSNLDAVLFTHEHKDHTAGLDDVRSFNFLQSKDMPVYARKRVIDQLMSEFSYVFKKVKYPGVPRLEVHEIENQPFQINGETILPIEVKHHLLPVFGFRINDFAYITDANYIDPDEMDKLKGLKVLVLNALQNEPHISHFTLEEAIAITEKINPEMAYFTHISHKLGQHRVVQNQLPERMALAYDGLKIHI